MISELNKNDNFTCVKCISYNHTSNDKKLTFDKESDLTSDRFRRREALKEYKYAHWFFYPDIHFTRNIGFRLIRQKFY